MLTIMMTIIIQHPKKAYNLYSERNIKTASGNWNGAEVEVPNIKRHTASTAAVTSDRKNDCLESSYLYARFFEQWRP